MLIRILVASFVCTLAFGCANSNTTSGAYTPEEINAYWFKRNLKREGVVATDSGLQYKILTKANGCKPDTGYKISVHYKMISTKTSRMIDSSYQRGGPSEFHLSKMIKGWREGVPMMNVGETWEFYIPPNLAYGNKGAPGSVAPNSVLTSVITLVDAHCKK